MAPETAGHSTSPESAALASRGAIVAPPGRPAATASRPDSGLDEERIHVYESNPAPWWLGLIWATFFVFGATYLIVNLLR